MRHRFFDAKLYAEGLRQLRPAGIVYGALLGLQIAFCVIAALVNNQRSPYRTAIVSSPWIVSFMLPATLLVFSVLMPLWLFGFGNKRAGSDFYHAAPHRRPAVFLSFATAALTLLAAGVTAFYLIQGMLSSRTNFTYDVRISMADCLRAMGTMLAIVVMLVGIGLLAVCVTGTRLANLAVAGCLFFLPALFQILVGDVLRYYIPLLPADSMPGVLDSGYNALYRLFSLSADQAFTMGDYGVLPDIWFLAVGVVMGAAGLLAFCRRRSETAGRAAINRPVQAALRILFALLFCIYPCSLILENVSQPWSAASDTLSMVVVWYALAVAAYFLYELVTSRSVRGLLRAVPALGILVLVNVGAVGGLAGYRELVLSDTPEAGDIRGVRFEEVGYHYEAVSSDLQHGSGTLTYRALLNYDFSGEEIRRLAAEGLKSSALAARRGAGNLNGAWKLTLTLNGRSIRRNVSFTGTQVRRLVELAGEENAGWYLRYADLPAWEEVTGSHIQVSGNAGVRMTRELYETLRGEVEAKDPEAWSAYLLAGEWYADDYGKPFGSFMGHAAYGVDIHLWMNGEQLVIRLSDYLPETLAAYIDAVNRGARAELLREPIWSGEGENGIGTAWYYEIDGLGFADENGEDRQIRAAFHGYERSGNRAFVEGIGKAVAERPEWTVDITEPLYRFRVQIPAISGPLCLYINAGDLPAETRLPVDYDAYDNEGNPVAHGDGADPLMAVFTTGIS